MKTMKVKQELIDDTGIVLMKILPIDLKDELLLDSGNVKREICKPCECAGDCFDCLEASQELEVNVKQENSFGDGSVAEQIKTKLDNLHSTVSEQLTDGEREDEVQTNVNTSPVALRRSSRVTRAKVNYAEEEEEVHQNGNSPISRSEIIGQTKKPTSRQNSAASHSLLKHFYPCADCGRTFLKKSAWLMHRRVHTGERPYECGECKATFTQISNYKRHVATVHRGERPFKCTYCGRAFTTSRSVKDHFSIHTGETSYKCKICKKRFKHQSNASRHRRNIHFKGEKQPNTVDVSAQIL